MKTSLLRKMICGICMLAIIIPMFAQQKPARLIVRSDDMGSFHSANVASIDAYRNGIQTSIEVMVVTPWFPEAVKMLRENPGLDVGIHLVLTSEWENIKWRPLTPCPSLVDENGYFYPMMGANENYPGQSISEIKWNIAEIEQEFRAQIELGLKNMPQTSHLTGHMFSTAFDPKVAELVKRLSEEYNLPIIDTMNAGEEYGFTFVGYDGPKVTPPEKEEAFIRMLEKLEPGKTYVFLDHPAYNDSEMQTVGHIGYEDVALDRQGVTSTLTSPRVKKVIEEKGIFLINFNEQTKSLPRGIPSKKMGKAVVNLKEGMKKANLDLHSLMVVQNGNVIAEEWMSEGAHNKPHVMFSVSKTYTATAIGFAVAEGKLKVTDKVISFFPDKLPKEVSPYLKELEIRHLLTMSVGHDLDPSGGLNNAGNEDWIKYFLSYPIDHKPGTFFVYNSLATFMCSAILQKVTGEKLINYLYPRLFRPLGIVGVTWEENPQGINIGGWGLYAKTEDMAKLGQFFLQKGKWNGKQLLPESWFDEATTSKIASLPAGVRREDLTVKPKDSDWLQGYGYQMWRCRHNAYRADGKDGQYIIVLPEKNAVIITTANIGDMQAEINLIWKHILPAL